MLNQTLVQDYVFFFKFIPTFIYKNFKKRLPISATRLQLYNLFDLSCVWLLPRYTFRLLSQLFLQFSWNVCAMDVLRQIQQRHCVVRTYFQSKVGELSKDVKVWLMQYYRYRKGVRYVARCPYASTGLLKLPAIGHVLNCIRYCRWLCEC